MHQDSWTPRQGGVPGGERLTGQSVTLIPVTEAGVAAALAEVMVAEDPALWRYMAIGPFGSEADFLAMLEEKAREGLRMMAILPEGESPAGMAAFMRMRPEHGCGEVGSVAYGARLQRSRAGTEAIFLMLRTFFDTFGWRRVEWLCNAENAPSFRAGQRYGFTHEGTFRQHRWVKGANRDTLWAAMLDREWPERKAAFEAWLADENFDEDGRQRSALAAKVTPDR